jgi:hypothetical protein
MNLEIIKPLDWTGLDLSFYNQSHLWFSNPKQTVFGSKYKTLGLFESARALYARAYWSKKDTNMIFYIEISVIKREFIQGVDQATFALPQISTWPPLISHLTHNPFP